MAKRVATLGGGHGQAVVLRALRRLDCEITAVISVADDGGCSGKLREELGMPPPGDLRRCLTALARDEELAHRFELRLDGPDEGRSAGNLALAEAYRRTGSLQQAVDWAAGLLGCVGRVVPVSESPGVLVIFDPEKGAVTGESRVEGLDAMPLVAAVHGVTRANPLALEALEAADCIVLGPGSFFTSTLGAVATAEVAAAVCRSPARKVLVLNLREEGRQTQGFAPEDYVRLLSDHLLIHSHGEPVELEALGHHDTATPHREALSDGTPALWARVAERASAVHDPELLAEVFAHELELGAFRAPPSMLSTTLRESNAEAFGESLDAGRRGLPRK